MAASRTHRLLTALAALALAGSADAQHEDLSIYSTANGGGALSIDVDLDGPITVTRRLPFCPAGICPYSSVAPGFLSPASDLPGAGLFALDAGTRVSFELVAIDAAASVKIGGTVLDDAGESAPLGQAPELHLHPEWQVQAPEGVTGDYPITFRLTTSAGAYADSTEYTAVLTNRSGAAPTATPTATAITTTAIPASATPTESATPSPSAPPTATATARATDTPPPSPTAGAATPSPADTALPTATASAAPPCRGDCNGDGVITVNELISGVNMALGTGAPETCPSFDASGDGTVSVAEIIQAVNDALSGC